MLNSSHFELVYNLAILANNVYFSSYWINNPNYNVTDISLDNNTVKSFYFKNLNDDFPPVISFKGTSTIFGLQENGYINYSIYDYDKNNLHQYSTYYSDKFNDNLYFSCCFYKQSSIFNSSDCDCKEKEKEKMCCKKCYKDSLQFNLNYIKIASNIINNIKDDIDFNNIVFTGHSLGGTIATLMGILYNKTAISFQSPGNQYYLDLIGLTAHDNIYHFGHNADPLFLGNCGKTCSTFGYHVYTKCHSGYTCSYDAKEKLNYTESILNHRIDTIIKNIIPHWRNDFPHCVKNTECSDCESWTFY